MTLVTHLGPLGLPSQPDSPEAWCDWYRSLGLPASLRGAYVELRTNDAVAVLQLPRALAEAIFDDRYTGPVLGPVPERRHRSDWKFLVRPDYVDPLKVDRLAHGRVRLVLTGHILLPTAPDRHAREGCQWVQAPTSGTVLPVLSHVVVRAAALETAGAA